MKKVKRIIRCVLIVVLISLILTHYLEGFETRLLSPFRELIYFGAESNIRNEDIIKNTYYKFYDEPQVNPVHVAQQVKSEITKIFQNKKLTKQEMENIITVADFLINYKNDFEYEGIEYSMWPYNFDYPTYELKAPWYSAMAQGLGIEVLIAAYKITDDDKYLHEARLAANALLVPIEENGVAIYLNNGDNGIWFEEYAKKTVEPPMVLNGHNFALIGIEKLLLYDETYIELYRKGIKALEYKLPCFDAKVWSRYDLVKLMANPSYQQIHINQLKYLGEKNNNEILLSYARKFTYQKYIPLGATYRLLFYRHNSIVLCFLINTVLVFLGLILVKTLHKIVRV